MVNKLNDLMQEVSEPSQASRASQASRTSNTRSRTTVTDKDGEEICSTMLSPGRYTLQTGFSGDSTIRIVEGTSSIGGRIIKDGEDYDDPFHLLVNGVQKTELLMGQRHTFTVE